MTAPAAGPPESSMLATSAAVSAFTGDPFVLLTWSGPTTAQMTPDEARELALHIIAAADSAETDALVLHQLKGMGIADEHAAHFLVSVRQRREKQR